MRAMRHKMLLLALALLGSASFCSVAAVANPPAIAPFRSLAKSKSDRVKQLPKYLRTLWNAKTVDASAIGFAALKSDTYKAFEEAAARGNTIRPALETMLVQASPAGRVYAAILLARFDQEAGAKAWQRLQTDRTAVVYWSGCIQMQTTISKLATDALKGDRLVGLRTDS